MNIEHPGVPVARLRCYTAPMIYREEIQVETSGHRDIHDITGQVAGVVSRSSIADGLVNIFNVGSTASIGTIEFEPGLERDLPEILDKLIPPGTHYGHEQAWHDGNGHSHLQATLLGQAYSAPVAGGRLATGTWQQIVHLECDVKPRTRRIIVTVMGA